MHTGGYYPRATGPPGRYGTYGNGNGGGGFRYGRGPPHRLPAPPEHQMSPREKEQILMAAGRLAAEYLVDVGDLPPDVLDDRPPAPIPFQQQGPPAFRFRGRPPPQQQHHGQFNFQGPPQRRFLPGPRPFQFGGRGRGRGHGPFPKRPRDQGPPGSFPHVPGLPAPPHDKKTGYTGQQEGAAPAAPVAESEMQEDTGSLGLAGDAGDSQPTAQTGGAASGAPQQMDEPSSSSLGANDSKSS